jgi:hypothetical protein
MNNCFHSIEACLQNFIAMHTNNFFNRSNVVKRKKRRYEFYYWSIVPIDVLVFDISQITKVKLVVP